MWTLKETTNSQKILTTPSILRTQLNGNFQVLTRGHVQEKKAYGRPTLAHEMPQP